MGWERSLIFITFSLHPMLIEHSPPLFTRLKVRYLTLIYLLTTIGTIVFFVNVKTGISSSIETYTAYSVAMAICCFWAWQNCRKSKINPRDILGVLPRRIQWLRLIGLILATLLFSAGTVFLFLWLLAHINIEYLQKALKSTQALSTKSSDSLIEKAFNLVVTVVVAPITEEFLFRGIILQRWAEKWGISVALIATSLLFGLLHFNIFGASIFGLIMGLLYIQTKTLWIPIICHFLNNFLVSCPSLLSGSTSKSSVSTVSEILKELQYYWLAGLILIAISSPFLWRFIRKNFPRRQRA
jgi:uncharacterized protein